MGGSGQQAEGEEHRKAAEHRWETWRLERLSIGSARRGEVTK
jgi:hypothetical protein